MMQRKSYSWYQQLVQKFASTRAGAWFFARTAHHADRIIFKLTGGRTTLATIVSGIPVVMLTTTGARTGYSRTTPVLFVQDSTEPTKIAVIASNLGGQHHPAWYYNLKTNPRAIAQLSSRKIKTIAHEATGEEYARIWQAALEIYPGYSVYKQLAGKRRIPIMVLALEELTDKDDESTN